MEQLLDATAAGNLSASADAVAGLQAIGREFHGRGWSLGTSSNYSVVLQREPLELLITASGKDKSALETADFVRVDAGGRLLDPAAADGRRSSAETLLHCLIAELIPDVGAVLHTHSVWATILSRAGLPFGADHGSLQIAGYEMLKGLEGITTHETCAEVPIFANSQDMADLSDRVRKAFVAAGFTADRRPPLHGFLLSGHGLYTWGRTLAEARRHIEIFEFLFEVTARQRMLPSA